MGFQLTYVPEKFRKPKARKVFRKIRKRNNFSKRKKNKLSSGIKFVLDEGRMKKAEQKREQRRHMVFVSVLFFGIIISFSVFEFGIAPLLKPSPPNISGAYYKWDDHCSTGTYRELTSSWILGKGYISWGKGNYEEAIWFFEHAEGVPKYWWKRDFALLSIYGEHCSLFDESCEKYKSLRLIMKDDEGNLIADEFKDYYYEKIILYNKQMVAYYEKKNMH